MFAILVHGVGRAGAALFGGRVQSVRPGSDRPLLTSHSWVAYCVLFYMCGVAMLAGTITLQYPPDYFNFPVVWGVGFFTFGAIGGVMIVTARFPTLALWSGAVMSGLAFARGIYIGQTVPFHEWLSLAALDSTLPAGGANASRVIACAQWTAFGLLMFLSWPALLHDTRSRHARPKLLVR